MSVTIDDLVKSEVYELPNGSRITRTEQKADPEAGAEEGVTCWQSFPPDKINLPDEVVKSFAEFLILNPAMECNNIESSIFADKFEFKVVFAPLNDPNRERTTELSLCGYLDESQETGFRLEFTPELPITENLKNIFTMTHKRLKMIGTVKMISEEEFKELAKNGKEIKQFDN